MNRRKRIVIISVIVGSLLLCIMAAIFVNRDSKTLPLAVTFRIENGHSLVNYEVTMPSAVWSFSFLGTRIQCSTSMGVDTTLLRFKEGAWQSELLVPNAKSTNGMLQLVVKKPTEARWKLKVTSFERPVLWIGQGASISSPIKTRCQNFESQVFTNSVSNVQQ